MISRSARRDLVATTLVATTLLGAALGLALVACGGSDDGVRVGGPANPSGVGNRCERDADCANGTCYLGPGGGYCTTPCSDEGSEAQCPLDTVCKPIQGGPRRCLLICGSASSCPDGREGCGDDFCPSGSSCVSVSETSARACEPEPR